MHKPLALNMDKLERKMANLEKAKEAKTATKPVPQFTIANVESLRSMPNIDLNDTSSSDLEFVEPNRFGSPSERYERDKRSSINVDKSKYSKKQKLSPTHELDF